MYGPVSYDNEDERLSLDWRNPFCHSIYWAVRGLQYVPKGEHSTDELHLRRMVYHSLQNLRFYGRMEIYSYTPPPPGTQRAEGQENCFRQAGDGNTGVFASGFAHVPGSLSGNPGYY